MATRAHFEASMHGAQKSQAQAVAHAPGDLYAVRSIGGHAFVVRYGYAGGSTRAADLIPLFPDLVAEERYDDAGWRIACAVNEGCEHYRGVAGCLDDNTCMTCGYYPDGFPDFGICGCEYRRKVQ